MRRLVSLVTFLKCFRLRRSLLSFFRLGRLPFLPLDLVGIHESEELESLELELLTYLMTDGPSHRSESFHLEHCFQICQLRFRCELRNLAQADEKHQKEQQLHRSSRLTSSSSSSTLLMPTADSSTHLNLVIYNNQWTVNTKPLFTNL